MKSINIVNNIDTFKKYFLLKIGQTPKLNPCVRPIAAPILLPVISRAFCILR